MDHAGIATIGETYCGVTQLGFGTAPLGGFRYEVSEREAIEVIQAAHSAGIRYFDTSPYYGYGRAELLLGSALRGVYRGDLTISTKIGRWMSPVRPSSDLEGWRSGGLQFMPTFDYSYDGVMRSIEQSWMRMGMNKIDIVFIHDVDFWTTRDRAVLDERFAQATTDGFRALEELKRSGDISAIGVGLNETDTALRFIREVPLDCVLLAGRYTLLEQGGMDDFFPECRERNVSVIIGGPYNSGILATGAVPGAKYDYADASPEIMEKVAQLQTTCLVNGVDMQAAALQFPFGQKAVKSVIPGATSIAELQQNVDAFRVDIDSSFWDMAKIDGAIDLMAPTPE